MSPSRSRQYSLAVSVSSQHENGVMAAVRTIGFTMTLQLLATKYNNGIEFDYCVDAGQTSNFFWAARIQIGELLRYSDPMRGIAHLHKPSKERLDKFLVVSPEFTEEDTELPDWDDYAIKYGDEATAKVLQEKIAVACMNDAERKEYQAVKELEAIVRELDRVFRYRLKIFRYISAQTNKCSDKPFRYRKDVVSAAYSVKLEHRRDNF